jgi:hypothetical protein
MMEMPDFYGALVAGDHTGELTLVTYWRIDELFCWQASIMLSIAHSTSISSKKLTGGFVMRTTHHYSQFAPWTRIPTGEKDLRTTVSVSPRGVGRRTQASPLPD